MSGTLHQLDRIPAHCSIPVARPWRSRSFFSDRYLDNTLPLRVAPKAQKSLSQVLLPPLPSPPASLGADVVMA